MAPYKAAAIRTDATAATRAALVIMMDSGWLALEGASSRPKLAGAYEPVGNVADPGQGPTPRPSGKAVLGAEGIYCRSLEGGAFNLPGRR
jgi:hypothetical protein